MSFVRTLSKGAVTTASQRRILFVKRVTFALVVAALFAGCSGCSQCGSGGKQPGVIRTPPSITNFSVIFVDGEATLFWTDPQDTSFDHVIVSWDPGGSTPVVVAKGVEKLTVPGLNLDQLYSFTVKAVDEWGNMSDATTGGTGKAIKQRRSPNIHPSESIGVKGTPLARQATLSWTNLDDSEYDHTEITYGPGYESVYRVHKGVISKTLTGLTNGVEHIFYAVAIDAEGNRKPLNDVGVFISGHSTSPESIFARPQNGQITLVWADPNDPLLDHIEVVYSPDGEAPVNVPRGVQTHSITDLSDNTDYEFTVYAASASGHRRPLTGVSLSTPIAPPPITPPPVVAPPPTQPREVVAVRARPVAGQIRLDWTDPALAGLDHIELLYNPGGGATPVNVARGVQTHSFDGLSDNTEYAFQVYGVTSDGTRQPVQGVRFQTPTLPRVAVRPIGGEVTVTWVDPDDPDLNHIEVNYSPGGSPVSVAKGVQRHTFTGLSDNTEYTFTVVGVMNNGRHKTISGANAAVRELPTITGTPTNGQLSLSWEDPPGVRLDHVEIIYTPGGERAQGVARGVQNQTFPGLTNGREYTFTVYGVDSAGNKHPVNGAKFYIPPPPAAIVTGVTVSPSVATVAQGTTQQFSATVVGSNDPPQTVTWSVTGGTTGTSISAGGLLTVGANQTPGALTVRATSTADNARSATAGVTVPVPPPTVTGVTVNPGTVTVAQGTTQQFSATVTGTNNPPQTVTWTVTGGTTGTSISSSGLLTVGANQAPGALAVRATSTLDTSRNGTAAVTVPVPPPTVTGVTVSPSTATVAQGSTQQFTATVTGTNNPPQTITWTVSGATTGTSISSTGLLTVGANQTPGSLTVRATSTLDTSRNATAAVTVPVPPPTVTGVTVSPSTATVAQGTTHQFSATIAGANNPAQTVTWTVTGGTTGTSISSTGLLTVAANQTPGSLTVRATSTADTSRNGTATVTVPVPNPTVTGVTISPEAVTVNQGGTQQFTATVVGTNDPPQGVTWTVTGGSIGTSINSTGLLNVGSNQAPGPLTIRATSTADTTKSGMAVVTVPAPLEPLAPPSTGPNPLSWTPVADSTFGDSTVLALSYGTTAAGAGRWVAGGTDGRLAYSENNGVTWRSVADTTFGAFAINAIGYGNGRWIAAGRSGRIAWSTNATSWTSVRNTHFTVDHSINAIAYGNGRWIAGGSAGIVIWSTDNGVTWNPVTISSFGQSSINTIAFRENRWIVGGTQGKMAYSNDNGLSWTAVQNSTFGEADINVIIFDKSRWFAGGYGQRVAWSTDGLTWRQVTRPFYVLGMGYNGYRWVAGGQDGRMAWSVDSGDNWVTDNGGRDLFGVSWVQVVAFGRSVGAGRWFAGGQNGKIIYADEQ